MVPENSSSQQLKEEDNEETTQEKDSEEKKEETSSSSPVNSETGKEDKKPSNPGFEVSDDEGRWNDREGITDEDATLDTHGLQTSDDRYIWETETQVDIFSIAYRNGKEEVTVRSDNNDKVIAPGTENSYTFKLKNTGDTALKYDMTVEAFVTPGNITLPVDGRINRYDGKWLAGSKGSYTDILDLNGVTDSDRLAAGRYTYYTLDWMWPFESGNDEYDTLLGNMAVDEDITLTIRITTTATATESGGGIVAPDTGDDTRTILWLVLAFASALLIILLVYYKKKMKDEDEEEPTP
ncbi:MAG: LPXTG cell wall anchor domain-containing protein [Oscillospiraceae bacterium]|nr:LPXTG cell wall anchor domain-containing protein [Oscillospiraceae bacterium]